MAVVDTGSVYPAGSGTGLTSSTYASGLSGLYNYTDEENPFGTEAPWDFSSFNEDKPQNELDKDAFLRLFVEQLQNQDPLNPMDADQMVAQLATFSQLEQAYETNEHLEMIENYQASINSAQTMSLLGNDVQAGGNLITLDEAGKATSAYYVLPDDATEVTFKVYDHTGEVVYEQALGTQEAGLHDFTWPGTDADGNQMPAGPYFFKILAYNSESDLPMEVTTACQGTVTGVRFDENGVPYLLVGPYDPQNLVDEDGQPIDARIQVPLSDVLEVIHRPNYIIVPQESDGDTGSDSTGTEGEDDTAGGTTATGGDDSDGSTSEEDSAMTALKSSALNYAGLFNLPVF